MKHIRLNDEEFNERVWKFCLVFLFVTLAFYGLFFWRFGKMIEAISRPVVFEIEAVK